MSKSRGIGWHFGGRPMARPYSDDLRERVVEAVKAGASRREAAERFEIAPSSAIKWLQRWRETGSVAAKPTGGSVSPLEEHASRSRRPWCHLSLPETTSDSIDGAGRRGRVLK